MATKTAAQTAAVKAAQDAAAAAATKAAQDKANADAARTAQYSFVNSLANTNPEIKDLLNKASAGNWSADVFGAALQQTGWWKTNSDTARKQIALQATDPAAYQQGLNNASQTVVTQAHQLGVNLDPGQIGSLAQQSLANGWDSNTLSRNIATTSQANGLASFGQSQTLSQQMDSLAYDYGVPITDDWKRTYINQALTSGTGIEAAKAALEQQAMSAYPTLAEQLKGGATVSQIAQPYIAQMGQTLEIDPQTVKLTDPTVQQALKGQPGAAGQPAAPATLYDFTNQLRKDPRWDKTDNAKQAAYGMLHSLGNDFGFAS